MKKTPGSVGFLRRAVLVAALVLVAGASAEAAGSKAEAKRHYRKGVTAYNLGHFEDAVAEFEQVYSIDPSPILLYDIAQAHRQLGDSRQALFFFRRYLDEDPNTQDRARIEQSIQALEEASRGSAAAPPPASANPPSPSPGAPPLDEPMPVLTLMDYKEAAQAPPAHWQRPAAWVAAGLAVGALGLGIQQNLAYARHRRDFNDMESCGELVAGYGSPACNRLHQDARSARTLSLIGYVGGGILAAVSAGLFYYGYGEGSADGPRTASRSSCRVLGAAGSCTFLF